LVLCARVGHIEAVQFGCVACEGQEALPHLKSCLPTMMKHIPETRRQWSVLGFCLIALALAVFVWGLSYKLSLYDPPQASSHRMVAAKLLSNRERPETAKGEFQQASTAPSVFADCAFPLLFLPLLPAGKARPVWTLLRRANSRKRLGFVLIPHYFFRPPPSLR
jgi:hypothetical protein